MAVSTAWTLKTYGTDTGWTWSVGGSPVITEIGNATANIRFIRTSGLIVFRVYVLMGSTTDFTTMGSGVWTFTSPLLNGSGMVPLVAHAKQSTATYPVAIQATVTPANSPSFRLSTGASTGVSKTAPFTWAAGDTLTISGALEDWGT